MAKKDFHGFQHSIARLTITTMEDKDLSVIAQYNPHELQITQPVTYNAHQTPKGQTEEVTLMEFGGVQPQTMQIELLFDGYEASGQMDVPGKDPISIAATIDKLKKMSRIIDVHGKEEQRRPYNCVVTWGSGGFPRFLCVIESLVTKYTMFGKDGRVLRATVTLSLKEADLNRTQLQLAAEKQQNAHKAGLRRPS
jgi:hypothetical protein